METYNNTITIQPNRVAIVQAFATEYYDQKEARQSYKTGDRDTRETRIKQAAMGKLAEEAVAEFFKATTGPDYTHYPTGTVMSDQPDLMVENLRIHVKACKDFYSEKDMSWMASEWSDPVVTNPHPDDILVFCAVCSYTKKVKIMGMVKATELVGKWDDPRREDLKRRGKKAIYWPEFKAKGFGIKFN